MQKGLKATLLVTAGILGALTFSGNNASADVHQVVEGDTVYDIAMAHNKTVTELVELNNLENGGALIFVGNELKLDQEEEPKTDQDVADLPKLEERNADIEDKKNTYPFGQCTWYVKASLGWTGDFWGNAGDWGTSALSAGYEVNGEAKVGAVAVFAAGLHGADANYGHVAVVEQINDDGTMLISEGNAGRGLFSTRTVPTAGVQFIHNHK